MHLPFTSTYSWSLNYLYASWKCWSRPSLTLDFLRGPFWAYGWHLKAISSKRKVLGRSQWVSLWSSWNFHVNSILISIWKDGCWQEILKSREWTNFPFVDITTIYRNFILLTMIENCQFSMDYFSHLKVHNI